MKLTEKMLERELDRLAPILVDKALERRRETRPGFLGDLTSGKWKTLAAAGVGCAAALTVAGKALEAQRMRRAVRRELRKALDPVEKQLEELKKQNEALRKELRELKS